MKTDVTSIVEDPDLVEKRRHQIVVAATQLFSEQGFYKTTIKDIAKKAGVSAGLVYLYVREKEDVLLLVLLQVVEAYAREIPKAMENFTDPLERLMRAVEAYCRVVDGHRAATVLAYRSTKSLSPDRRELIQQRETETNDIIANAIVACMKAGLIRKLNVDVLTYQLVLVAHGWALKSWYFKSRLTLEEYIVDSLDILLAGVLTPVGQLHRAELRDRDARNDLGPRNSRA
ncbi:TetR/AcrR family transcriptional regulator [Xanthobacter dioxanivorans]|uniref:TetR/AcrR family transcriptional regulator n=1 Tax=Xanthobacter dioxanivorans TaxID=2528964 RepID=A0A974SLX7_9HYPH|nr:TetR/AcrR family transcriptional regulator [Xanthobacter dioxanivorans]QRG09023.1 TetR/AcrR family transcriptional regulator [Xanthobacter dioxanivorans]